MEYMTENQARAKAARLAAKRQKEYYVIREGDGFDVFSEDDDWMIEGQTPIAVYGP